MWQQDRLGRSNLEPRIPKGTPRRERFRLLLAAPMTGFEYNLIAANAIIIAGSSIMSGAIKHPDEPKAHRQETTGKAMRAFPFPWTQTSVHFGVRLYRLTSFVRAGIAGIANFIALVQVVALVGYLSYRKRGDRTLLLVMLTWPLLTVRGIYGILSVVLPSWNCEFPSFRW